MMVQIRYLTHQGDKTQTLSLAQAKAAVTEELDKGNVVYNEDEKRIIERATMGQIQAKSNLAVFPAIRGG